MGEGATHVRNRTLSPTVSHHNNNNVYLQPPAPFQAVAKIAGAGVEGSADAGGKDKKEKKRTTKQVMADDITKLVLLCKRNAYDPLIVFSFSKRECEAHAQAIQGLDLNNGGFGFFWGGRGLDCERSLPLEALLRL
jgi:superfamily II RNA helicase